MDERRFTTATTITGAVAAAGIEPTLAMSAEVSAFQALFLANPVPMWIYDRDSLAFVEVNNAAVALYGYERSEFLQMRITEIRPAAEIARLLEAVRTTNTDYRGSGEWTHVRKDGSQLHVEISSHSLNFKGHSSVLVVAHDITTRKVAEDALRASESRYRLLFERNLAGVYRNRLDGKVLSCNEACARILGYGSARELEQTQALDAYFDPRERDEVIARLRAEGQVSGAELRLKRKDGSAVWVLANMTFVAEGGTEVIEGTLIDITDKKNAEEQIVYRAYHDALTGLPNRALFKERLWVMLNHARHHDIGIGVMLVDLDRFKLINDTMGHSVGDGLIREVATRLQEITKEDDIVARAGGDEFLLLLSDIGHSEDAARIAQNVLQMFEQPFTILGSDFYVTASIGIATHPMDGSDVETLLKNVDAALFHAKTLGRNNYQLSTPQMTRRALELLALEHGLRRALDREEFELFYQPQVELSTGTIVGFETLLRWKLGDGTYVDPGVFMGVAEDTRLIIPLGDWVLRTACLQAVKWNEGRATPLRVAVNLSGHQFEREDLIDILASALGQSGLAPEVLEVEITETTAMRDVEATTRILRQIKAMGVRVSMDDFGTGHSSLNHLRRFPLNMIKIDQTFVRDILEGSSRAIIKAIVEMAHALELRVLAEGVETEEQRDFLATVGCEEIQGFLISRPRPATALDDLLSTIAPR